MKIKFGTRVYSLDGEEVGIVKEAVVNPVTREVTHLVVQEGLLFENDQLIAVDEVESTSDDGIVLRSTISDVHAAAGEYQEDAFARVGDDETGLPEKVWIRPPSTPPSLVPPGLTPGELSADVSIPMDEVAILHGCSVRTSDGTVIGSVNELLLDDSETITHLVIDAGVVFSEPKLVPIDWIKAFADNEVVIAVDATVVEQMPDYEAS